MPHVLIVGESWTTTSIHVKGFDSFTTVEYQEGVAPLRDALTNGGHQVSYMPNHVAATDFPFSLDELEPYDVIILSDIGSNTLLLPPSTFSRGELFPNRLALLREWTYRGGGLAMIGGYLSFQGIEAKANYRSTPLADALPAELEIGDDRIEGPEDPQPRLVGEHPMTNGLPQVWPHILGYQRVTPKPDATVLAVIGPDPLLAVGEPKLGRSLVYTSDIGPHWAPPEFVAWDGYARLWTQAVSWLAASEGRLAAKAGPLKPALAEEP